MKLKEFINSEAIVANLNATTRDDAIRELVASLASAGAVEAGAVDDIVECLLNRERNGSTGFGKGVAVPHVKHPTIKKMAGTLGRSAGGIDFSALDSQPVYSICLLLSPENQPQQHLQAMNCIFTTFMNDMFRKFLRQSDTQAKLVDLIEETDSGK